MEQAEIWMPVKGFEGYLEVSNYGNIKALERDVVAGTGVKTLHEYILKPRLSSGLIKYPVVTYSIDKKQNMLSIGRVVYEAFNNITIDSRKQVVIRKDGNVFNNRLDNIKIITRRNVRGGRSNKSGYVGVNKQHNGAYMASIKFEGKAINLHYSTDKYECHKIYQLAKAMIDEYDKLKAGILSNSRLNNKLIVKSLPIK
jgi:hypothetical protein